MFPVAALFSAKKRLNGDKKKGIPSGKPTKAEGFSKLVKVPFERRPSKGTVKAIILDYDGTLRADAREHGGEFAYPVKPSEVKLLPNRTETIRRLLDSGEYDLVLGITTQSGIGKGVVSEDDVIACIAETNRQLDVPVRRTYYCPHYNFPVSCYCRKPQVGLGVAVIRDFDLDPSKSVYVGDQTSDKTFAKRCGLKFEHADTFFKG
jgi:D-glycero-D-manno-heptose 1,7-bisphosphate phosphatase